MGTFRVSLLIVEIVASSTTSCYNANVHFTFRECADQEGMMKTEQEARQAIVEHCNCLKLNKWDFEVVKLNTGNYTFRIRPDVGVVDLTMENEYDFVTMKRLA
jgi:hypothetical protein